MENQTRQYSNEELRARFNPEGSQLWKHQQRMVELSLGFLAAKLDKKYENRGMLGVKKHVNVYRFLRNYFGFSHLTFSFSHLMASLLHIF